MSSDSIADLPVRVRAWLAEDPDETTRAELQQLLDRNDVAELHERFDAHLEFGTAGLRGVLGAGPNRMNRAVVIRTTAGLCEYLRKSTVDFAERGIVIGFDARRMSRRFAEDAAEVCAGYGIRAELFADIVPTPLVSFAVIDRSAVAGIMVTASHNPPEYNGYKVYWSNGAQIIPPHDAGIAACIAALTDLIKIPRPILKEARAKGLVVDPSSTVEFRYLEAVSKLSRRRPTGAPLKIAYTPLHGVGDRLARAALEQAGFSNVHSVAAQAQPDAAFPTVRFPNPEEPGAMDMVIALATEMSADLVLANDPDADRLAVATPDRTRGTWRQLTGNEVGVLLAGYLLIDDPHPTTDRLVITTVVSSPMLAAIATALSVRHDEVLTGFKWIANRALEIEKETGTSFVFGYEEALGYSVGTVARDKDGISAAALFAELTNFYVRERGRTLLEQLDDLYARFGLFVSAQRNVTTRGPDGPARINGLMDSLRRDPPERIGRFDVSAVTDLASGSRTNRSSGTVETLTLPRSNVLAFALSNGGRVTVRPSGTEPKVKYYFDMREPVGSDGTVASARERADKALADLITAFLEITEERGRQT